MRAQLPRCPERDMFKQEYGRRRTDYHTRYDKQACEAIVGKQIEIVHEILLTCMEQTHHDASEGLVCVYAGNHRQQ